MQMTIRHYVQHFTLDDRTAYTQSSPVPLVGFTRCGFWEYCIWGQKILAVLITVQGELIDVRAAASICARATGAAGAVLWHDVCALIMLRWTHHRSVFVYHTASCSNKLSACITCHHTPLPHQRCGSCIDLCHLRNGAAA